jgi:hypothetical protein
MSRGEKTRALLKIMNETLFKECPPPEDTNSREQYLRQQLVLSQKAYLDCNKELMDAQGKNTRLEQTAKDWHKFYDAAIAAQQENTRLREEITALKKKEKNK